MNTPENPYEPEYGQEAEYLPPPPPAPPKKVTFWSKLLASKFFFISVAVHVLFGIGAAYYIVQQAAEKKKLEFKAAGSPGNNPNKRALEHKVSMAQKKKSGGAPPQAKRIAAVGAARVALPDMPAISSATTVVPGMAAGMGGAGTGLGFGIGPGAGGGMGGGGGGGNFSFFGFRGGGNGLVGVFYDLKQTRDRKGNPPARDYTATLKGWVEGGMKDEYFKDYFRAPNKLMATQFIIPKMEADEAPKAYGVEKDVKPSQWIAVYRGKIQPPSEGDWCFLGQADDIILVAINGKLILDGSWHTVATPPEDGKIEVDYASSGHPKRGYVRSKPVHFGAGEWADVMIAIGEQPGGKFWAVLGAEKAGSNSREMPLFKTASVKIPDINPAYPYVNLNGPVWRVQSAGTGSMLDQFKR